MSDKHPGLTAIIWLSAIAIAIILGAAALVSLARL